MLVARAEFEAMPVRYGGDLWNDWKLYSKCFEHPEVQAIYQPNIGTGLWADVRAVLAGGTTKLIRVYG